MSDDSLKSCFCKTPTEDDADHSYDMGWKVATVCDGCRACRHGIMVAVVDCREEGLNSNYADLRILMPKYR